MARLASADHIDSQTHYNVRVISFRLRKQTSDSFVMGFLAAVYLGENPTVTNELILCDSKVLFLFNEV